MTLSNDFYANLYQRAGKRLCYQDMDRDQFESWSAGVTRKLSELLKLPEDRVPPDVRVISREQCEGFSREKIVIKNGMIDAIPAYVLVPETRSRSVPGIICLHGHGGYFAGKDMVAGVVDTNPIAIECAEALNYGYGVQLAKAGFVTICPDSFGFGERVLDADRWSENHICDTYLMGLETYGFSAAGVTMAGHMQVIDYLQSRPEVRDDSVGCIGMSYGGWQSYVLTCLDKRIGAAVVSGALSCFADAAGPRCGAQTIPGMLEWFDQVDIQRAIAPRPTLYEIMKQDSSFDYKRSMAQYSELEHLYESLGISDRIDCDIADTDHRYIGSKVEAFFNKHLG